MQALHKEVEQSLVTTSAPGNSASAPAADPALATACQVGVGDGRATKVLTVFNEKNVLNIDVIKF